MPDAAPPTSASRLAGRRRALAELRAGVELALTDAEDALRVAETARRGNAARLAREDVLAAHLQLEVLDVAERAIEAEADEEARQGAQDGRGAAVATLAPAAADRPPARAGAA